MSPRRKPWDSGYSPEGAKEDGIQSAGTALGAHPKPNALLFTQPGCLSCELMRIYLEASEIAFEERDISADSKPAAR